MNNKKTIIGMCITFYFLFVAGCNLYSFGVETPPYVITGKVVNASDNTEYKKGGFYCNFRNDSDKTIKDMFISFFLFDNEGEPIQQIAIRMEVDILPSKESEFCVSLDNVLKDTIKDGYSVDFIYASKIIYDDGSQWDDPMGLNYLF